MSLALARKYRPLTFDELIGQETISQTLSLALEGDRLSHAYLFSGLRGSGKTSTARIFAKALLCEKGVTAHPCGVCSDCIMAVENRHLDIIEMDAASNRGIDDIKELIEHTKYKPSSARYKIFIIDEVHMLTNPAFNALLKTLEEPPSFVKFILATTDPLKLPATILSRTQHFRFRRIPQHLILQHLEHILNLEQVGYEKDALEILARCGAGSLRDSLTLTDQAIVYSKNFVDTATVTGMLGIIEPSFLEALLMAILNQENDKILAFIKEASNYEAEMILDEVTLFLKERLLSLDTTFSPLVIERFFRVIAESKSLLALGSDSEFVLALCFFKMRESLQIQTIDHMIKTLEHELQGVEIMPKEAITITTSPITPLAKPIEKRPKEPIPQKPISQEPIQEKGIIESPHKEEEKIEIKIETEFQTLIKKIYNRDYDLGEIFEKNIFFESFQDNQLTWHSQAQGEDKKTLITYWGIISMFVKEVYGVETKIINIPKAKEPQKTPFVETNTITIPQATPPNPITQEPEMKSSCIAPEAGETESAKEKDPSTLLEEPMIKKAMEMFDPKKVRIKRNS